MMFCPPPFMAKSKALVLIDRTTGTNIGTLVNGGGLAAAFDGNNNQTSANSALESIGGSPRYVGKTLASPRRIGRAVTYGSSNVGYQSTPNSTVTLSLRAKNGSAPSSATDGTQIGAAAAFTNVANANPKTIDSTDLVNSWDHVWLVVSASNGSVRLTVAELELYAWE